MKIHKRLNRLLLGGVVVLALGGSDTFGKKYSMDSDGYSKLQTGFKTNNDTIKEIASKFEKMNEKLRDLTLFDLPKKCINKENFNKAKY
ncbi:hypothetical protein KC460_03930 [Candidatus Dependentiae bacterium]|nr:hypothetical protein [Candidatus Dependentiae bacterium]